MDGQRRNWLQSIYATTRIVAMPVGFGPKAQTSPPRSAPETPHRGRAHDELLAFEGPAPF